MSSDTPGDAGLPSSAGRDPTTDTPSPPAETESACELCGGRALERHCKVVCTNCGFMRDCSDP